MRKHKYENILKLKGVIINITVRNKITVVTLAISTKNDDFNYPQIVFYENMYKQVSSYKIEDSVFVKARIHTRENVVKNKVNDIYTFKGIYIEKLTTTENQNLNELLVAGEITKITKINKKIIALRIKSIYEHTESYPKIYYFIPRNCPDIADRFNEGDFVYINGNVQTSVKLKNHKEKEYVNATATEIMFGR